MRGESTAIDRYTGNILGSMEVGGFPDRKDLYGIFLPMNIPSPVSSNALGSYAGIEWKSELGPGRVLYVESSCGTIIVSDTTLPKRLVLKGSFTRVP